MKSLIVILNIFIISSCFVFININQASSDYHFETDSGLFTTGNNMGYEDALKITPLPEKIGKVISIGLAFLGVLFLLLMIYGGYIWMMARGNEQEVEKAKNIIIQALIGLIIVLSAYAITAFLGSSIINAPIPSAETS